MIQEYQDHVTAIMPKIRSLANSFALGSSLDPDELFSIGMLEICKAAQKDISCDPVGFLYCAARYGMIKAYQRSKPLPTVSLDAPISDDNSLTLADVLSSPTSFSTIRICRVRAINEAINGLRSPRQRAVLQRRYGLEGYGIHSIEETAKSLGTGNRAVEALQYRALKKLTQNSQLCAVMEVAR